MPVAILATYPKSKDVLQQGMPFLAPLIKHEAYF